MEGAADMAVGMVEEEGTLDSLVDTALVGSLVHVAEVSVAAIALVVELAAVV